MTIFACVPWVHSRGDLAGAPSPASPPDPPPTSSPPPLVVGLRVYGVGGGRSPRRWTRAAVAGHGGRDGWNHRAGGVERARTWVRATGIALAALRCAYPLGLSSLELRFIHLSPPATTLPPPLLSPPPPPPLSLPPPPLSCSSAR